VGVGRMGVNSCGGGCGKLLITERGTEAVRKVIKNQEGYTKNYKLGQRIDGWKPVDIPWAQTYVCLAALRSSQYPVNCMDSGVRTHSNLGRGH